MTEQTVTAEADRLVSGDSFQQEGTTWVDTRSTGASTWGRGLRMVAMFALGVVVGVSLAAWRLERDFVERMRNPEHVPEHFVHMLDERIGLTSEQQGKIRQVVLLHHGRITRDLHPQLLSEIDSMDRDVERELRADQKDAWRRFQEEMRARLPPVPLEILTPPGKH